MLQEAEPRLFLVLELGARHLPDDADDEVGIELSSRERAEVARVGFDAVSEGDEDDWVDNELPRALAADPVEEQELVGLPARAVCVARKTRQKDLCAGQARTGLAGRFGFWTLKGRRLRTSAGSSIPLINLTCWRRVHSELDSSVSRFFKAHDSSCSVSGTTANGCALPGPQTVLCAGQTCRGVPESAHAPLWGS